MAFNTPSWPWMIYRTLQGSPPTCLWTAATPCFPFIICLSPNTLWVALYPPMSWVLLQDSLPTSCSLHSSAANSLHPQSALLASLLPTLHTPSASTEQQWVSEQRWEGSGVAASFLSILSHLGSALVGNVTFWSSFPALEDALEKVQCCRHSSLAACSQDMSLEVPLSSYVCVFVSGDWVVVHICYIPKPYTGCSRIHLFFLAPFSHLSFLSSLLGN